MKGKEQFIWTFKDGMKLNVMDMSKEQLKAALKNESTANPIYFEFPSGIHVNIDEMSIHWLRIALTLVLRNRKKKSIPSSKNDLKSLKQDKKEIEWLDRKNRYLKLSNIQIDKSDESSWEMLYSRLGGECILCKVKFKNMHFFEVVCIKCWEKLSETEKIHFKKATQQEHFGYDV